MFKSYIKIDKMPALNWRFGASGAGQQNVVANVEMFALVNSTEIRKVIKL